MLSIVFKQTLLLILILLLEACAQYTQPMLKVSDITASKKINATIESVIVTISKKNPNAGLIKSMKKTNKEDPEDPDIIPMVKSLSPGFLSYWKTSIEKVISKRDLFRIKSNNVLVLRVDISKITRPYGLTAYTTIIANYKLINTSNSAVIFNKEIKSLGESVSGYLGGIYRLQESLFRSINKNIKIFFGELQKVKLPE